MSNEKSARSALWYYAEDLTPLDFRFETPVTREEAVAYICSWLGVDELPEYAHVYPKERRVEVDIPPGLFDAGVDMGPGNW